MKKYRLILIFCIVGLFFGSCDVEVENPNNILVKNHWKTERDAEYGVNAVYNMFYKPGLYSRWIWFRYDTTSDEGYSRSPWASLKEWTQFRYTNYDFSEGNALTYKECYQAIFRANQVLHYVPEIPFEDPYKKERILGQAYFLRGLFYYNLAILWGSENKSLAINLEDELPTPGMKPLGHTKTEVFEQAIHDLGKAQQMLPATWSGDDKGRATKGAALAFKAKCHMQLHQWNEAKNELFWMVEGAGKSYYNLVDYAQNFLSKGGVENNIESVFEIQYSDIHKAPAGDSDFEVDPNLGQHRGQFFAPPGIGWNDAEMRPWIVDEFKKEKDKSGNYDIRLKYTAFYPNMHNDFTNNTRIYNLVSNNSLWGQSNWTGRVFCRKYSSSDERDTEDYYNPINIRLIRYSDVLLMYAECIAESGGSVSTAVSYVDRVRTRANMPLLSVNHASATTDRATFLKRLQMERSLELATEGHRWADLQRWGLLETTQGVDELKARDADFDNFIIGKHNTLPIPSTEKNNNPNIEQNPNY